MSGEGTGRSGEISFFSLSLSPNTKRKKKAIVSALRE